MAIDGLLVCVLILSAKERECSAKSHANSRSLGQSSASGLFAVRRSLARQETQLLRILVRNLRRLMAKTCADENMPLRTLKDHK
jgi:hypothetical protein